MISEVEGCEYIGGYEETFENPGVDVIIAGAQKSGTTSLKEYLRQHESIFSHNQKEFGFLVRDEHYGRGYDSVFEEYFGQSEKGTELLLAKSVSVMYIREAMRRAHFHNQNCKIVVIIRDPVERAYSSYWYMRQQGWEGKRTFEEAIEVEERRLEERGELARHCGYVDRGLYSEQIKALRKKFGEENILTIKFNKFKDKSQKVCSDVFEFMGVGRVEIEDLSTKNETEGVSVEGLQRLVRNLQRSRIGRGVRKMSRKLLSGIEIGTPLRWIEEINKRSFEKPKMKEQTESKLRELFRPDIRETQRITGLDLSDWLGA